MTTFNAVKKILLKYFSDIHWHSVLFALLLYLSTSWILLWLCGEQDLISNREFLYWIVVTASTVGYGDLSPVTTAGKICVALYVIPMGLALFGLAIGRVATFVSTQWRKRIEGLKNINYSNHILLIGWNEQRTLNLIHLLLHDLQTRIDSPKIALCVKADITNPLPEDIGFAKVSSYNRDLDMERAGVKQAACIIIDNPDDEVSMTTALYCAGHNPQAHIIVYFEDESLGNLLKQHCPNIECMPSVSVEMIAKSAVDPGSSILHHELLRHDHGMTQYSVPYTGDTPITVQPLFLKLKALYGATLIGISKKGYKGIVLNPELDAVIHPNGTIYYIANERIQTIDWSKIKSESC